MSDPLVLPGAFNVADHFLEPNLTPVRSRRPYVLCGDETSTYGELDRRSRRFASALTRLGVEPENRVMLLLLDTPAFPVAFWGAIRAGAVAVPINTLLSTDDYRFFLADSRAKVLLVDRALWEKAEPALDGHRYLKEVVVANGEVPGRPRLRDLLEAGDPQAETVPMTPGDPAFWLYTSGSTGEPKAAVHLHSHMVAVARSFPTRVLGLRPDDVSFSAAKLFFAFGLGNGLWAVVERRQPPSNRLQDGKLTPARRLPSSGRTPASYRRHALPWFAGRSQHHRNTVADSLPPPRAPGPADRPKVLDRRRRPGSYVCSASPIGSRSCTG